MKFFIKQKFELLIVALFTGSVFLTSGKFVNEENTPKLYFVIIFSLLAVIYIAIFETKISTFSIRNSKILSKGIFIICFFQAILGILQYAKVFPSNHSDFLITGSFDNPAGIAALLSISSSIGLYCFATTKRIEKSIYLFALIVIITTVIFSNSRTGILTIIISSGIFFITHYKVIQRLREHLLLGLFMVISTAFLVGIIAFLYSQNKNSSNGRLLIWRVSLGMVKDKPLFGHGYDSFQADYMDYQAQYFKNHPNSKYKQLADNVKHPFNEYIKIMVEYGIIGFIIFTVLMTLIIIKAVKIKSEQSHLMLSGIFAFLVFAFFSYPLQYVTVWVLIGFYLSLSIPAKTIHIRRNIFTRTSRICVLLMCSFLLFHNIKQVNAKIKWNKIAQGSLGGNTIKVISKYDNLYPILNNNPFFLYNYGAELNEAGKYQKSVAILRECKRHFNDYDLQLLMADNYYHLGDTNAALNTYTHASNMIPCRFWPLYQKFKIYKLSEKPNKAKKMAKQILQQEVKISSSTVSFIKSKAKAYVAKLNNRPSI